jgi:inosine/xanthosine triphosphate pyrophosphatase family protein
MRDDIFRPPALEKKLAEMKKNAAEEVSKQNRESEEV